MEAEWTSLPSRRGHCLSRTCYGMVRGRRLKLQTREHSLTVGLKSKTKVTLSLRIVVRSSIKWWCADLMNQDRSVFAVKKNWVYMKYWKARLLDKWGSSGTHRSALSPRDSTCFTACIPSFGVVYCYQACQPRLQRVSFWLSTIIFTAHIKWNGIMQ